MPSQGTPNYKKPNPKMPMAPGVKVTKDGASALISLKGKKKVGAYGLI